MSVMKSLNRFCDWRDANRPDITSTSVNVLPQTMVRLLKLRPGDAIMYRGLSLRCVGSVKWRQEHQGEPVPPAREKKARRKKGTQKEDA